MGGIKLPDGRNSWEITYDKSWVSDVYDKSSSSKLNGIEKRTVKEQEYVYMELVKNHPNRDKMGSLQDITKSQYLLKIKGVIKNLQNHKDFRNKKRNSEALDYLVDELKLKDSYRIKDVHQIESLIKNLGKDDVYIVYRFVNKETGLERHGETLQELLERIGQYIIGSEDLTKSPSGPYYQDISNALKLDTQQLTKQAQIEEFFNNYEVEIWLCDSKVEMDALEIFNTLYYNRAEGTKILSDLGVNNRFNEVYGNTASGKKAAVKTADELLECFKQSLSDEEVLRQTGLNTIQYINRRYIQKYFNGKIEYVINGRNIRIKAESYNDALKQYTVAASRVQSDTDRTYIRNNKVYFGEDLIWTLGGPEGKIIGLFYGMGDGLSESYFRHLDKFSEWFRIEMNIDTRPSMSLISETVHKAIMEENYRRIGENIYEFKFDLNKEVHSFIIKLDNRNRIIEIIPIT